MGLACSQYIQKLPKMMDAKGNIINGKVIFMQKKQQIIQNIALVVFDVDGVLTDGSLLYGNDGEVLKVFNVKDGVGIKLLQHYGIEVAVISAKQSAPLKRRVEDLKVRHFYPKSHDKWHSLKQIMQAMNITPEQVCFVGDDVIDLKVMRQVGLSVCPSDAFSMVLDEADIVTAKAGGKGVAREVADMLLAARMNLKEAYTQAMLPEFEQKD